LLIFCLDLHFLALYMYAASYLIRVYPTGAKIERLNKPTRAVHA